jgi:hypothetical protein
MTALLLASTSDAAAVAACQPDSSSSYLALTFAQHNKQRVHHSRLAL